MTAVTDTDSSLADDEVVTQAPFPFWLATILVTAESEISADGIPLDGNIFLTPNTPLYLPGWSVVEGSATINIQGGVALAPVRIPCTDAISPGFTYTIYQRLLTPDGVSPAPITGVSIPHTLGATVDISSLL